MDENAPASGSSQKKIKAILIVVVKAHDRELVRFSSDFKEINGDMLQFLGRSKGGKNYWYKELLKNGKLEFEDVDFVKEFTLADESQVLLKVPRKNNMYSVDMNNIFPKECLTYLVAKTTLDESML
ncbi:hypothetical protein Tco_0835772 [Tanacetum coccineum]